ncbi:ABC transporter substrate-binding protein [Candidatus Woesearchaeota archaeon]|jgi:branched-chain amino acid transport system substrate-binding protein|nr:ABC transporter substrate-binding protein [Candidatus Woesearchaeota archaeon]MBT3537886.1 ABC transporter substrate-binding protein [Candidatus Woesearchaeota archaeon]MBT4698017.1 ABC transporter substrate-binding protein [Candidatus Woesearchaeota archaeon]MBT4716606.1 ABC transporter substrate-binding protein [Candidatus Woesearchaeota archaeon]MBT7105555.1 ABC transporter substrate-binding protein [Candidatus Woesearchaeota archaeon]
MSDEFKIAVATLLCLMVVFAGCSEQTITGEAVKEETIKIGAILMLTGPVGTSWGEYSLKGIELAIKEINANGGINGKQVELIVEDNRGDNPKVAISAFHKLVNEDKVSLIIGPNWSPSGLALAPLADETKIVMVSPSLGVADFNEHSDYIFNLWPHDVSITDELARHVYDKGYRRVAVLGSLQVWEMQQAERFKKTFEEIGGEVVSFQLPNPEDRELRAEAAKIKASDAEAVVFTNMGKEGLSAKRIRESDVKIPFFSILLDDEQLRASEGALEDTVIVTSFTPIDSFVRKFKEEYSKEPLTTADTSYDSVVLLSEAIKAVGSDDATLIAEHINSLRTYSGASGDLIFDGKGGVNKPFSLRQVQNGVVTDI